MIGEKEKQFVDMIINGLSQTESFKANFPEKCEGKKDDTIRKLASNKMKTTTCAEYFNQQGGVTNTELAEFDDRNWTQEESIIHLKRFLKYAEDKIYNEGAKMNVAMVQAVNQTIDKLNLIQNLYDKGVKNINIKPIVLVGFNKTKGIDSDGNIVDGNFTEVKKEVEVKNG